MTDFAPALFAGRSGRERNPLSILYWLVLTVLLAILFSFPIGIAGAAGLFDLQMLETVGAGEPIPEGPGRLRQETVFMAVLAASLVGVAFASLLAGRIAFRRPMSSFLTPAAPFRPALLLLGALVFAVLVALAMAADPLIGGEALDPPILDAAYPAADRLLYALASVLLLLFAAAAEEVIFRGVLLQVTGAFTRNVLLLALINGLLFSAIHIDFDPASFIARTLLGAAFTWTVLKLGGLEFAIGAHAANNIVLSLLGDPISEGASVQRTPDPIYAVVDAVLCIGMVVAVLALSRTEMVRRWTGRPAGSGF
ncbi:MAG TPA: CPBP family intramembrane glutamic endopeptidase [Caulobacteraceae bacterium]